MIDNGIFSSGWTDMPPAPGHLINQQPKGWFLSWVAPGQSLFGSQDKAGGVPECVHKLSDQLPANEQLGGNDALILAGDAVYKIFHSGAAFGAELTQTITGLEPGSEGLLIVPVLAVLHGDTDAFGAESGAWVNGVGSWVNGADMGNRRWYRHKVAFTVPDDGRAEIIIRVKSKWPRPKDFFIDDVKLEARAADPETDFDHEPDPFVEPVPNEGAQTVRVSVPEGLRLVTAESGEPG
ncbi:MAG: hypothetical protein R3C44_21305 [Chloroflexota bacterium]